MVVVAGGIHAHVQVLANPGTVLGDRQGHIVYMHWTNKVSLTLL